MAGYRHLEIVQDFEKYVKDKKTSAKSYYRYLLSRLLRMFQYKNLPDTIPHEILDRYLFEFGIACITKVNGELYVFSGNLGGVQDVYYRPTTFIISNPHIKVDGEIFTANIPVFENPYEDVGQPTGVLMRNDMDWIGLHPLLSRYAYLMAENILTLRTADVLLRIVALLTAKDDKEQKSALEYLKTIEKGELGVIGESKFFEGVEMQSPPSNNGSYLTQFIEYQQYLKGSFYNEIGLSANYNMKREAIGKGESTLDEDALLPLCDNMLRTRKEDIAKVNKMFGTNIEVEFSSSWLENRIEALAALNTMVSPQPTFSVGQPTDANNDAGGDDSGMSQSGVMEDTEKSLVGADQGLNDTNETGEGADECNCKLINDLSVDEELDKLLDDVVNQDVVDETLDTEGGEEDVDETEGSEDKENISED